MAIDKKYFNSFVLIFALMGALILAVATFWFSSSQQEEFQQSMMANDSLATRHVNQFHGIQTYRLGDSSKVSVLMFWNAWVEASTDAGSKLQDLVLSNPSGFRLFVAPMHTPQDSIAHFWDTSAANIRFVDGNDLFKSLHIPGVPASVWINKNGDVVYAQIGYLDTEKALSHFD
jgi:hypothetical protein